jgi:hypothetical protein
MNFDFEKINIFGWLIHLKKLKAGESYTVKVSGNLVVPSTSSGNITLWTKGRITGINIKTKESTRERIPGVFSLDTLNIPCGDFLFTAEEDSEWLCINYIANRKKLPKVEIKRGNTISILADSKILVCSSLECNNIIYDMYTPLIIDKDSVFTSIEKPGLIMVFKD